MHVIKHISLFVFGLLFSATAFSQKKQFTYCNPLRATATSGIKAYFCIEATNVNGVSQRTKVIKVN